MRLASLKSELRHANSPDSKHKVTSTVTFLCFYLIAIGVKSFKRYLRKKFRKKPFTSNCWSLFGYVKLYDLPKLCKKGLRVAYNILPDFIIYRVVEKYRQFIEYTYNIKMCFTNFLCNWIVNLKQLNSHINWIIKTLLI